MSATTKISEAPDAGPYNPSWRIPVAVPGFDGAFSTDADQLALGGEFLPLIGGALSGNLTINSAISYAGDRYAPTKTALNIAQTLDGQTAGLDFVGASQITVTDTLAVNAPDHVLATFQASITGQTLDILTPVVGPPLFSFTAAINANTLTILTGYTGTITAGLTLNWATGSATIMSGGGSGGTVYTLDADYGIVAAQAMSVIGPTPGASVSWDATTDDVNNPTSVKIASFAGVPGFWNLTQNEGLVPSLPMALVKSATSQAAIGLWFNHYYGGGGANGGRLALRAQLIQSGPMLMDSFYTNLIGTSVGFSAGGTDLWNGSSGKAGAFNPVMNMVRRSTTPGVVGAINYAGQGSEFDYGCAAGSPDDPNYPLASCAVLSCATFVRYPTHQFRPPLLESDCCLCISQAQSGVRDLQGNTVPIKAAMIGLRWGAPLGVWSVDTALGRALGACFTNFAFTTNGAPGAYPMEGYVAVDWFNVDWKWALYRGRGISLTGSRQARPYALQVGGGYLSASGSTVSLDTCGAEVSDVVIEDGGANLIPFMSCVDDDTGTQVVVLTVDNAVRRGLGAGTSFKVIPRSGRGIMGALPVGPIRFRPTGNPKSFPPPGPTGPLLTLVWFPYDTLALQPSGGAITSALLPNAANDAAAAAIGVGVGQWYRNGSAMMQRAA
jgi:hypothetical protein